MKVQARVGSVDDIFAQIDAAIDGRVPMPGQESSQDEEGGGELLSWIFGNNDKGVPWKKARPSKMQGSLSQTKFDANELISSINAITSGGF